MKLTFLGSGDAFVLWEKNFQSNLLLEAPSGKRLLVDCGSDIRNSLAALGFDSSSLEAVYISHLHGDHIGGLEWLAYQSYFKQAREKPRLFIHESLSEKIWDNCLSGGLASLKSKEATLETFFEVNSLQKDFFWEKSHFSLIQMTHVFNGKDKQPCFGLFFHVEGKKILFTSDTQFIPEELMTYYKSADLIFHDCETMPFKSGVHASYTDLVTLPLEIKSKMWLYHYNEGTLPQAKKDGFKGFVSRQDSFDLLRPEIY